MIFNEKPNKLCFYNPGYPGDNELIGLLWKSPCRNTRHVEIVIDINYFSYCRDTFKQFLLDLKPYYPQQIKKLSIIIIRSTVLTNSLMKSYVSSLEEYLVEWGFSKVDIHTTWTYVYVGSYAFKNCLGVVTITHIPNTLKSTYERLTKISQFTSYCSNIPYVFLNVAQEIPETIVDGPGIRYSVYSQGCIHNCPGCHNPSTHSFELKNLVDVESLAQKICRNKLICGVTFSGGDPILQAHGFWKLAERLKKLKPNLNIIIYTGYTMNELKNISQSQLYVHKLLNVCDYIVDGRFEIDKRSLECPYRGSTNQKFLDIRKFQIDGSAVEIDPITIR